MPLITKPVTADQVHGFTCDRCHRTCTEDDDLAGARSYHVIRHVFGYGTPLDTLGVTIVVCERCLASMILDAVPDARFAERNGRGDPLDPAEVRRLIAT